MMRRWSSQEEDKLRLLWKQGYSLNDIAKMMDRTRDSINFKVNILKLIDGMSDAYVDKAHDVVCELFGYTKEELYSSNQGGRRDAKHILRYIIFKNTRLSLAKTGKIVGNVGHDTVIKSIGVFKRLRDTDKDFKAKYTRVMSELRIKRADKRSELIKLVKSDLDGLDSKIAFNELIRSYL